MYREERDADFVDTELDTILKLVPKTGAATNLTFKNAAEPSASTVTFGDASHGSILLEYQHRWVTAYRQTMAVVEIENGKPVWRHARNVETSELQPVEVWTSFSGASRSAAALHDDGAGHAELLHVRCGLASPKNTCTSTNRIFFVRDGRWWWAEREGESCKPTGNGWCAASSIIRAEFPSATPSK